MFVGITLASPLWAQDPPPSHGMLGMIREAAQGYLDRALDAERSGRVLEAEVLYLRALETDPGLLAAHLGYARLLDARGHRAEAVRMLAQTPRRAWESDGEAMEYARTLHAVGQTDAALGVLRDRAESPEATRMTVELASAGGRFPEALAAARRLAELTRESADGGRAARVMVRALTQLVAEADAVRAPLAMTAFRRLLRGD